MLHRKPHVSPKCGLSWRIELLFRVYLDGFVLVITRTLNLSAITIFDQALLIVSRHLIANSRIRGFELFRYLRYMGGVADIIHDR